MQQSSIMNQYKPKVLVVPSSYFAGERTIGGGERYANDYARALARLTDTTMALFGEREEESTDGSLKLRTFGIRHRRSKWWFPLTPSARRGLANYDVIHLMVFPTPATDTLLILRGRSGQLLVGTDVGGGIPCCSTYLERIHSRLNLNRIFLHGLAPLSHHAARFFRHWPQPRQILFGGVNLEQLAALPGRPENYALYVGRLLPHKGILQVIQAVPPDVPLHVVGRPYHESYHQQLIQAAAGKQVTFITNADDAELQRQYAGANVVLQPSIPVDQPDKDKSELLGLVALEGMANAKPVIVTRTASLPELPVDGETGFVVPPHDLTALRERISQLVKDPELSRKMGQAARRHVEAKFTWQQVARRGFEFYEKLTAARTNRV